ncbi:competence protein ComK [Metabacillus arenae]|uniref:Competence protein ComK n=1 Tax=Metabacillus arenae TaxID=2771434 RepID=A0A926NMC1_9BACI|nr:competence protein ComK [Metabacillus arenae]MBD1380652.1 competence protein ComK [Metabacillus arenae]
MKTKVKNEVRYFVKPETMAIFPHPQEKKLMSKVIEEEKELIIDQRPLELIDYSCKYYSASYEGRKIGTRELIDITHKPPIIVDPVQVIYFFPTQSANNPQCVWISHKHVYKYVSNESDQTIVTFTNNKKITIPVSLPSFKNQLYRTGHLKTVMDSRIEEEQRRMNMVFMPPSSPQSMSMIYEQMMRNWRNQN